MANSDTPTSMFVSASSKLEAVTRLSALVGAPPATLGPGSKERKALLVDVAAGLGLDVDRQSDKPELGRQIASRLDLMWGPDCWSAGQTITLTGLNTLLWGTERKLVQRQSLIKTAEAFRPARSKLEAVTRIGSLAGGPPQTLGPGSKERKILLVYIAVALNFEVDTRLSKPELACVIVTRLGGVWDEKCWSAGQTITLEGLNRVLAGAERELAKRGARTGVDAFSSPRQEAEALLSALASSMPTHMDGRACVTQMHEAESTQWAQDEWRGFYFEYIALPTLINTFGGGPTTVANTKFDYSLGEIWDLKCHGDDSPAAILNSKDATDECLRTRGLGLLVLTGSTMTDDGEFRAWQRQFRIANGKIPKARTRPAEYQRRSKSGFVPTRLDAYFISSKADLEVQLGAGLMTVMSQGRQVDGSKRGEKYVLHTRRAHGSSIHLAGVDLAARQ